jgi:tRNA pseudouridine38-40 synthase
LDFKAMQAVAARFIGSHDFAAFGRPPNPRGTTVRHVHGAEWQSEGENYWFDVEANAFLYHMVRRLVAAMVAVGSGRETQDAVVSLIDNPEARWQGAIAPACGLCLEAVIYD